MRATAQHPWRRVHISLARCCLASWWRQGLRRRHRTRRSLYFPNDKCGCWGEAPLFYSSPTPAHAWSVIAGGTFRFCLQKATGACWNWCSGCLKNRRLEIYSWGSSDRCDVTMVVRVCLTPRWFSPARMFCKQGTCAGLLFVLLVSIHLLGSRNTHKTVCECALIPPPQVGHGTSRQNATVFRMDAKTL